MKFKIIPNKYKEYVNSLKRINPDYKYMLFDDKDIEEALL